MGQVVPLMLNWLAYGASSTVQNINVAVDLSTSLVVSKLKQIRSIYIDNMGSDNPIYVYFPSTDYAVVAQPNSAGWFRAYTNDFNLWVIGTGFVTGDIPTTKIIVANIDIAPAVDIEIAQSIELWKASATISRGTTIYNQNFGAPALGDQFVTFPNFAIINPGVLISGIFGTPLPSGFVYLTAFDMIYYNVTITAPGTGTATLVLESTGSAGILFNVPWAVSLSPGLAGTLNGVFPIFSKSGMQLKLDATQTWRLRVQATGGGIEATANFNACFTTNPQ